MTTTEEALGSTIESVAGRLDARSPVRIPSYRYVSAEWARLESERLWPRVWQVATTVDHLTQPGDHVVYRVGDLSVLILRDDAGQLRAYQNVCRHRGNELCSEDGEGLSQIQCPYHRWTWDLAGQLRQVPSRRGFGVFSNDEFPLFPVQVDTWGPAVFVNLDPDAEPLTEFLEGVPTDAAHLRFDEFRCSATVTVPVRANWKTLIDGFSETLHVQGIHPEMLAMTDDVNSPQTLWERHGKLSQPYGVPSPRLRNVTDEDIWRGFVDVMGVRVGEPQDSTAGPAPEVPAGQTMRDVLERRVREQCAERGVDLSGFDQAQVMDLSQYNLFPNVTFVFLVELLQVVKSRQGPTPDECYVDLLAFDRVADPSAPRPKPPHYEVPVQDLDLGLVFNQDFGNVERAQRGLHQPGLIHFALSGEEGRIVNLHRNLERWLGVPSEITGG